MGDPEGYAQWAFELVQSVYKQYGIDTSRVAFGGYSSGAQWTTEFFGPRYGAQIMTDGVAVAISYGGSPKAATAFTDAYRANVPYVWDTGDQDPAWTTTGAFGVKAGYDWYTANGFTTQLHLVSGLGHSRSDFAQVMAREIDEHVPSGASNAGTPPPATQQFAVKVEPSRVGARFTVSVPPGSPATTVRVSPDLSSNTGWYLTSTASGNVVFDFTPYNRLRPATSYQYRVESGSTTNVVARGSFTTLP
jgi:hypothetical protein